MPPPPSARNCEGKANQNGLPHQREPVSGSRVAVQAATAVFLVKRLRATSAAAAAPKSRIIGGAGTGAGPLEPPFDPPLEPPFELWPPLELCPPLLLQTPLLLQPWLLPCDEP